MWLLLGIDSEGEEELLILSWLGDCRRRWWWWQELSLILVVSSLRTLSRIYSCHVDFK